MRRHCTRSVAAPVGTPAGGGAYQLLLAQHPQEAALIHRAAGEGHRLLDRLLRGDHCCKVAYPKSLDSLSLGEPDPTVDHDLLAQALSKKHRQCWRPEQGWPLFTEISRVCMLEKQFPAYGVSRKLGGLVKRRCPMPPVPAPSAPYLSLLRSESSFVIVGVNISYG